VAKNIVVGAEYFPVRGERLRSRLIADVVIPGNVVKRDGVIELRHNTPVLGDLEGVAGLVDEVAANDDKGGFELVRGGDGALKIDRFLSEIAIFRKHAELRVGHLNKGQVGCRGESGKRE